MPRGAWARRATLRRWRTRTSSRGWRSRSPGSSARFRALRKRTRERAWRGGPRTRVPRVPRLPRVRCRCAPVTSYVILTGCPARDGIPNALHALRAGVAAPPLCLPGRAGAGRSSTSRWLSHATPASAGRVGASLRPRPRPPGLAMWMVRWPRQGCVPRAISTPWERQPRGFTRRDLDVERAAEDHEEIQAEDA